MEHVAKRILYQPGPLAADQRLQTEQGRTGTAILVWLGDDGVAYVEQLDRAAPDDFSRRAPEGKLYRSFVPVDVSHLSDEGWWRLCEIGIANPTDGPVSVWVGEADRNSWTCTVQPGEIHKAQVVIGPMTIRAERDVQGVAALRIHLAEGTTTVTVTPEMAAFDAAARAQAAWAAATYQLINSLPGAGVVVAPPGSRVVVYASEEWGRIRW